MHLHEGEMTHSLKNTVKAISTR